MFAYSTLVLTVLVLYLLGLRRRAPAMHGGAVTPMPKSAQYDDEISIGSYNIHRCKGVDGRRCLKRIGAQLGHMSFAGLYEVEGPLPWLQADQAHRLGRLLGMAAVFAPVQWRWFSYNRGNAFLSRLPVERWYQEPLVDSTGTHPRCLVTVWLRLGRESVPVLMTHLARNADLDIQLQTVLERFRSYPRAILMGDFNVPPDHPRLQALIDAGAAVDALADPRGAGCRHERIDGILLRGLTLCGGGNSPTGPSDHPCYWVRVRNPGLATAPVRIPAAPGLAVMR